MIKFDVAPIMENDRTLIPLRGLFEKMGEEENTIKISSWDKMNDIFSVMIPKKTEDTLIFEVILPNADDGGFKNRLMAY